MSVEIARYRVHGARHERTLRRHALVGMSGRLQPIVTSRIDNGCLRTQFLAAQEDQIDHGG
jgi:hypothetical protein